jgi:hypothetical protein
MDAAAAIVDLTATAPIPTSAASHKTNTKTPKNEFTTEEQVSETKKHGGHRVTREKKADVAAESRREGEGRAPLVLVGPANTEIFTTQADVQEVYILKRVCLP